MNIEKNENYTKTPPKDQSIIDRGQFYPKNIDTIRWLAESKLSAAQILVHDLLCCYYNAKEGAAWPSYKTMAKILKMNERTIKNAIKKLDELEIICKEKKKNAEGTDLSNRYVPFCVIPKNELEKSGSHLPHDEQSQMSSSEKIQSPSVWSNHHPKSGNPTTQLEDKLEENEKKFASKVPGMPNGFIPFSTLPLNAANWNSNYIPTSHQSELITKDKKDYQKDHLYFSAEEGIKKIYDTVIKINEDFGFTTTSWRMNERDLKLILDACKRDTPENIMNHMIRIATNIKAPKQSYGVSYLLKKYNTSCKPPCGNLIT